MTSIANSAPHTSRFTFYVLRALPLLMLAEKAWRWSMVRRFFQRPAPPAGPDPQLVSIMQPILSGDPTLAAGLEANLRARSRYAREFLWLVDSDDAPAQALCRDLIARYPACRVRLILLPPPGARQNPKMVKLIAGAAAAWGDVICVLDDDTRLPDGGLEQCLPYLDQPDVGLAFGLPYYVNFSNLWSSLVSAFVDSHSLLTYIPYTVLTEPFTINGMFYAVKRAQLAAVGGFAGLEGTLADDFAVAQRFRAHGLRLAQTPLLHGISTQVTGPSHYLSLIQRWFIFPRESLLRYLSPRDKAIVYGWGLGPALFPLGLLLALALRPSRGKVVYTLAYFGASCGLFAHLNRTYLGNATPLRGAALVPLIQALFPLQLVTALLAPQRIHWRGHLIAAESGGTLRFVRRRVPVGAGLETAPSGASPPDDAGAPDDSTG
ncbi:MAG: glycosyltransferase [Chloroflexota bacterium]|nr:glycosyltransferase [Chloroflexota bacterium]